MFFGRSKKSGFFIVIIINNIPGIPKVMYIILKHFYYCNGVFGLNPFLKKLLSLGLKRSILLFIQYL